ncbi:helix-turn-helix domain-containing protein [Salinarimonas soli]|uniref:Helix-turn-helix transcriptional regulator n=1 Tax=Salinarimonas soli TaxID=1638099 RepID=A0A5B2VDQ4_9HYPH|nr:AraC family transcriptional regulator [Salinarimonas soli]KAA2237074.1 helix-turn-helix transcriptional regulator [Salinarimonas soli]
MGEFAIERSEHADLLTDRYALRCERAVGMGQRWNMSAAVWSAPAGFDTPNKEDDLPHHILTYRLQGPPVRGRRYGGVIHQDSMEADSVSIVPERMPVHYWADGPVRFIHLYFSNALIRTLARECYGGAGDRPDLLRDDRVFGNDPLLRRLSDAYLDRAFDWRDPPSTLEMDSRALVLGLRLLQRHSTLTLPEPAAADSRLAPHLAESVREYLDTCLDRDPSLAELARSTGIPEVNLSRAFTASTGMPPWLWLTKRRIERARSLLSDPRL